jgi:hypothetical protein
MPSSTQLQRRRSGPPRCCGPRRCSVRCRQARRAGLTVQARPGVVAGGQKPAPILLRVSFLTGLPARHTVGIATLWPDGPCVWRLWHCGPSSKDQVVAYPTCAKKTRWWQTWRSRGVKNGVNGVSHLSATRARSRGWSASAKRWSRVGSGHSKEGIPRLVKRDACGAQPRSQPMMLLDFPRRRHRHLDPPWRPE